MSTHQEINGVIATLWASYIEKIDFDILSLKISFNLVTNKSGKIEKHELVFEGVSSFFFVNEEGISRFNTARKENAELSEVYYFEKPRHHIAHKSDKIGTPQFNAEPNFYLEIWGSVFMIEAKEIAVDGVNYSA